MAERFTGKTVLVTGSAGGLGRGFADGFAREGADLILVDVNVAGLEETAEQVRALGRQASVHKVDLASEAEIKALAAELSGAHERLDVLINNAGIAYGAKIYQFETLSQAEWLHFFAVNTIAPLILAEALRPLLAKGPGVIINQSSMASYTPANAYGATKAALNAFSYGMTQAFGGDGIRVNSIAPGLMETPANRAGLPPETYDRIQGMQVLKLHGLPDDIVNLGLFLASDDARFITGNLVNCDAGHAMRGFRV